MSFFRDIGVFGLILVAGLILVVILGRGAFRAGQSLPLDEAQAKLKEWYTTPTFRVALVACPLLYFFYSYGFFRFLFVFTYRVFPWLVLAGGIYFFLAINGGVDASFLPRLCKAFVNWMLCCETDSDFEQVVVSPQAFLNPLVESDPQFSRVAFEDFAGLLYHRFQELRGRGELEKVAGYFHPSILKQAAHRSENVERIESVIVASLAIEDFEQTEFSQVLVVKFETNYHIVSASGPGQDCQATEVWTFQRQTGVVSKSPEEMGRLGCPSCGAPGEQNSDGSCPYCEQVVNNGRFGWAVVGRQILLEEPLPPLSSSDFVGIEVGTRLETVFDPGIREGVQALKASDPDFCAPAFKQQVEKMFVQLQQAWAELDWSQARPLESDALFQSHRFWMERYRVEGRHNAMSDIQVKQIELAKVERDAFYDSITVRIHASMVDVTYDREGTVVAGHPSRPREFTEYWTLIRTVDHTVAKESGCPNCGAPIRLDFDGLCGYCDTKVVTGRFGWVVSKITQDEEYTG